MENVLNVDGSILLEPLAKLQSKIAEFKVNLFNNNVSQYISVNNILNAEDEEAIEESISIIKGRDNSLISQEESDIINEHISEIVNKFVKIQQEFNFSTTVVEEVPAEETTSDVQMIETAPVEETVEEIELPQEVFEDQIEMVDFSSIDELNSEEDVTEEDVTSLLENTSEDVNAFNLETIDTFLPEETKTEEVDMIDTTPENNSFDPEAIELQVEPVNYADEIDLDGLNALFDTQDIEQKLSA